MSVIKYQLREVVASLSLEANKNRNKEVKKRFYLIKAVVESPKDVKKTCEMRGFSTDFFYVWARRLLESKKLESLEPKSKSPKSFWNKTPAHIERRIIKIRKKEPFLGPERISFKLKKLFRLWCAPSTVAAILKRAGLVTKKYRDRLTKKHLKRYRRPLVGYLQMDVKFVPYRLNGRQYYELNAIDHHSSWRFIRVYERHGIEEVLHFLSEMEKEIPFPIVQIQTDNGPEFTDKFTAQGGRRVVGTHVMDVWCRDRGIDHKLIPVGEKELNGKVENSHKFDDREFYSQKDFVSLEYLQSEMILYNHYWNKERPTKTLQWRTPFEVVKHNYLISFCAYKMFLKRYKLKPLKFEKIERAGGYAFVPKKKKPKKQSYLDRYLQYLDWEDKNKIKSLLPLPFILQNFSRKMKKPVFRQAF
jgi:transposase InsO family protein